MAKGLFIRIIFCCFLFCTILFLSIPIFGETDRTPEIIEQFHALEDENSKSIEISLEFKENNAITFQIKEYKKALAILEHIHERTPKVKFFRKRIERDLSKLSSLGDIGQIAIEFLLSYPIFPNPTSKYEWQRMVSLLKESNNFYYNYFKKELHQFYSILVILVISGIFLDSLICLVLKRGKKKKHE